MVNNQAFEERLKKFKEPLSICVRLKRLDGSDKQLRDYLHPYKGAAWKAAHAVMDAWLADEAKKSETERERWERVRKDLAGIRPQ